MMFLRILLNIAINLLSLILKIPPLPLLRLPQILNLPLDLPPLNLNLLSPLLDPFLLLKKLAFPMNKRIFPSLNFAFPFLGYLTYQVLDRTAAFLDFFSELVHLDNVFELFFNEIVLCFIDSSLFF